MLEPLLLRAIQRLRSRAVLKEAQSGFTCVSSSTLFASTPTAVKQQLVGRFVPQYSPISHCSINRLHSAAVHPAEGRYVHESRETTGNNVQAFRSLFLASNRTIIEPSTSALPRAARLLLNSIPLHEGIRQFSSSPTRSLNLLPLNDLRGSPGSRRVSKRLGRGIGSGKGKTAGRGHKGQKARSGNKPKIGFEGGQTPLRLRLPKRGFHNPFKKEFQVVNMKDVLRKIEEGYIDPSKLITMKTLKDAGLGGKATRDGIKLLGKGAEGLTLPLHFEVSRASASVRNAIETAGGSLLRVHYNALGLRALLTPEWFAKKGRLLPRAAQPPPKILASGAVDCAGRLPAPTEPLAAAAEGERQVA